MFRFACAVLLMFATAFAAAGQLYRYVDKDGRVVYSDQPPPASAKQVEKKRLNEAAPDVALPFQTRDAMKRYPVTLYANSCGEPCDLAKDLLDKRGVPYTQKNPEESPDDAAALKKLVGGLEVPVLLIGKSKPIKGFELKGWTAALDTAGYPSSNPGVKTPQLNKPAAKKTPANEAASEAAGESGKAAGENTEAAAGKKKQN